MAVNKTEKVKEKKLLQLVDFICFPNVNAFIDYFHSPFTWGPRFNPNTRNQFLHYHYSSGLSVEAAFRIQTRQRRGSLIEIAKSLTQRREAAAFLAYVKPRGFNLSQSNA